jgi:DNA-binding IclR family transcriptional regulator
MSMETRGLATSLFKALDTLNLLSSRSDGALIGEVVSEMGLPRSSLIRILDSLMHYGLVERSLERRYRVTSKFRDWRSEDRDEQLVSKYRPLLRKIADEVGEMAVLGRLQGRRIFHLHYEEPDCRVRVVPPVGRAFAIEKMAMGKLALSQRPDLVPEGCSSELREEIARVGKDGFAWNRSESEEGIIAWGTWLEEPSPLSPMIAVTWPSFRYSDRGLAQVKGLLAASL